MTNNIAEGSFHFLCTKNSFFYFLSGANRCFSELAKFNFTIVPKESPKILEHLGFKIQQLVKQ
jgi:hypothetical protein